MNVIYFPGINLELKISKIAFSILGINIYNYAICIVIGIIVALIICKYNKKKFNISFDIFLDNCIIGLIFGIIGARAYFVLFNLNYYSNNLLNIFNFRNGGLAIYGGLILGGISIILNCKIKNINILDFFDFIIPSIAIAQSIGRWGNFFNVEAYGYKTNNFFRMGIETVNGYIEVHPVFLYESIATFIIFIILIIIQKNRRFRGQILLSYCLLYSGVRTILEGLRVDSLMLYNLRISQLISIIIFIISFIFLYKKCRILSDEKTTKY